MALLAVTLGVVLAVGEGTAHAAPGDEPAPVQPVPPIEPIQPIDPIGAPAPGVPAVPEIPVSADRVSESFARLVDDGTGGGDGDTGTTLAIDVPGSEDSSNIVVIILVLTVLSVAPSVLILMTSFTRIVIVLSLTRQALGIPQLPPQQVIVGLSLFLTLFIMGPTLSVMNEEALQPLLSGEIELGDALSRAEAPIREFMLQSTREAELELFLDASDLDGPITRDEVPLTALVPAFVLSELKAAFILGFVIFVPFLVIDLVTSAVLVSLGMMMLPPTFVSLPMKLLLFILLDGFSLVIGTLLNST
ncbi:MAG: flagellar type III secretion system pore protein FliP [Actinomycetota bacterium]